MKESINNNISENFTTPIVEDKIGIGIITYNRKDLLVKLLDSIKNRNDYELIIINDGSPIEVDGWNHYIQTNETNLGVAKSKNKALKHLLDLGCDHIFLIEDDMYIKDDTIFEKYIKASKISGIQHFNYSQHGLMNKTFDGLANPNPRVIIDYNDIKIALYPNCVGAFSYYSKKCLEEVGMMDERYYNACEHVDHTLMISKAGMHPPFWYFADIDESWKYLGDEEWSINQSTISSNANHSKIINDADNIFISKHGTYPRQIKDTSFLELGYIIKNIKNIKK